MGDMTAKEKEELYKKLDEQTAKLNSVLSILNNDKYTDRPGLVHDVDDLKSRVNNLEINERLMKQRISTYAGIAAFLGMVFAWLVEMTYNFFFRN